MSQVRILSVTFDTPLAPWELPRFRGAIAQKVGLEHEWFHNHDNETGSFHQRYPLIQYKIDGSNKQTRPMLLCLQNGIEEAHHFFSRPDWNIRIGDQERLLQIARLHVDQYNLQVTEQPHHYRIHHWKPFNPDNYRQYQGLSGIVEQFGLLESLLASHILAFANGVDCKFERRFYAKITSLIDKEWMEYKGIKVLAFTLDFESNLALPEYIGLGKGASMGYGVVRKKGRGKIEE